MQSWRSAEGLKAQKARLRVCGRYIQFFPSLRFRVLRAEGGINGNNTEISSADTKLKDCQSFQSTDMCPILR